MTASAPHREPRDFGKYRIVRKVAHGGMGTIYLALSQGPDGFSKPCALKTIRPQFSESPEFTRMLAQEARIAALLSHPNIVQVFDYGRVGEEYYLTMEWVDGASVGQLMSAAARRGVALGAQIAAQVGIAVADALAYIHEGVMIEDRPMNLVHRDVTPANILVSSAGAVKLTDFGIVKVLEAPVATAIGVVKGKHGYMAPEQIRAEHVDHRADLFSLGVVLYEMLTGRRLFKRKELGATVAAVLTGRVPPPSALNPEVPAAFDQIVLHCLSRRREGRPVSAAALRDTLAQFYASQEWSVSSRELAELVRALPERRSTSEVVGLERARVIPMSQAAAPLLEEEDGEEVLLDAEPLEEDELELFSLPSVLPDDPLRSISESSVRVPPPLPRDLLGEQTIAAAPSAPPAAATPLPAPSPAASPARGAGDLHARDHALLWAVLAALLATSAAFWWWWLA